MVSSVGWDNMLLKGLAYIHKYNKYSRHIVTYFIGLISF